LGVKNAAIHYHYRAKEDLLLDIIESYIQEYQIMGKQFRISNIDGPKKLKYFIEKYAVLIEQKSICIIGSLASDYYTLPELVREKVLKLIQLVLGMVELTLEEGKNNGIFFLVKHLKLKQSYR
jgi:AcrR family transcriptional regulator